MMLLTTPSPAHLLPPGIQSGRMVSAVRESGGGPPMPFLVGDCRPISSDAPFWCDDKRLTARADEACEAAFQKKLASLGTVLRGA